jgi:hypothetical protein
MLLIQIWPLQDDTYRWQVVKDRQVIDSGTALSLVHAQCATWKYEKINLGR